MAEVKPVIGYDYSRVLPVLKDDKWMTTRRVAHLAGLSTAHTLACLHTLYADGWAEHKEVRVKGYWKYAWRRCQEGA